MCLHLDDRVVKHEDSCSDKQTPPPEEHKRVELSFVVCTGYVSTLVKSSNHRFIWLKLQVIPPAVDYNIEGNWDAIREGKHCNCHTHARLADSGGVSNSHEPGNVKLQRVQKHISDQWIEEKLLFDEE